MPNPIFETSPVSGVILPGIPGGLSLKGLIVVVGPNSSGKTNLLRDIHAAASRIVRDFVVAREISLRAAPTQLNDYLDFFKQTGDIELLAQPSDNYRKEATKLERKQVAAINIAKHSFRNGSIVWEAILQSPWKEPHRTMNFFRNWAS